MDILSETLFGSCTVKILRGDITLCSVDAIVNAANSHLQHGGGVAGAIVRRGGTIIQEESDRIGYVPVGESAMTSGGSNTPSPSASLMVRFAWTTNLCGWGSMRRPNASTKPWGQP